MSDSSPVNNSRRLVLRNALAALAIPVILSACATTGSYGDPETAVRERAQAYWDARVVGDHIKAFGFEEASTRPDVSLQRYLQRSGAITYLSAEVQEVLIKDADRASVRVKMSYRAPVPGLKRPLEGEAWTDWVRIKGLWYNSGRTKDVKGEK